MRVCARKHEEVELSLAHQQTPKPLLTLSQLSSTCQICPIIVFAQEQIRNRNTLILSDVHSSELIFIPTAPPREFFYLFFLSPLSFAGVFSRISPPLGADRWRSGPQCARQGVPHGQTESRGILLAVIC
jgi:hypothetical protein